MLASLGYGVLNVVFRQGMVSELNMYVSQVRNVVFRQGMVSELNMYESQVGEYKYEIERLARELQDVKKKYFMQKKKEQQQRWVDGERRPTRLKAWSWLDIPTHAICHSR